MAERVTRAPKYPKEIKVVKGSVDPKDVVIYEGSGEWSAAYVKGELAKYGDHYVVEEWLHEALGVKLIQSNDFIRGGNDHSDVASSVAEIDEYVRQRTAFDLEAGNLEQQAQTLLDRAKDLRARQPDRP